MNEQEKKPKFHNFWYSEKQAKYLMQDSARWGLNTVNGIAYTEITDEGKRPRGKHDDYELVYTGEMKNVVVNRRPTRLIR